MTQGAMESFEPITYVLGVALILLTPGPTNTLLLTSGAVAGLRRSLPLLLAELSGYLLCVGMVGFVLKPLIIGSPIVVICVRLVAAAYLVYLAIATAAIRVAGVISIVTFRRVFTTTIVNPKGLIFALVLIPTTHPHALLYVAEFATLVVFIGGVWIFLGYTIGRTGIVGRSMIARVASLALFCFGVALIVSTLG